MKNIQKIVIFNMLMVLIFLLSGCKNSGGKEDDLEVDFSLGAPGDEGGFVDEISDGDNIEDVDNVEDLAGSEINEYLLALGMRCVEGCLESNEQIIEKKELFLDTYNGDSEIYLSLQEEVQMLQEINKIMEKTEEINAAIISYNAEDRICGSD